MWLIGLIGLIGMTTTVMLLSLFVNMYVSYHRALKTNRKLYPWPLVGNIPELILFHGGFVPGMFRALIDGMKIGNVAKCRLIQDITLVNDRKLWQMLAKDENLLQRGPISSPNQAAVEFGMTHNGLLMNSNIERWKYLRQIFLKGLTTKLIADTTRHVSKGIDELLTTYKCGPDGVIRIDDMHHFMFVIISKAILRLGFGIVPDEALLEYLGNTIHGYIAAFSYFTHTPKWLWPIFYLRTREHRRNIHALYDYIDKIISEKLKEELPSEPTNLIEGLLIAGQAGKNNVPASVSEIRQCLAEMMLAGFDTSTNTAAFMFYSVAGKRGIPNLAFQTELQDQVDKLIMSYPDDRKWVEYTAKSDWPLIGATVRETLRAQPVAEFTSRGVDEPFDVTVKYDDGNEHTYHIPQGRIVFPLIPEWTEAFPACDRFDPMANFINNPNFLYASSFGEGPRQCPGRFLAEAELRSALVTIMRDYTLRIPNDSPWKTAYDIPRKMVFVTQIDAQLPLELVPRIKS